MKIPATRKELEAAMKELAISNPKNIQLAIYAEKLKDALKGISEELELVNIIMNEKQCN